MSKVVKMNTLSAGPRGVLVPGQVVALPDEEADALVRGRYAEPVDWQPASTGVAVSPEGETATAEPPENAMKPRMRRRKRGR